MKRMDCIREELAEYLSEKGISGELSVKKISILTEITATLSVMAVRKNKPLSELVAKQKSYAISEGVDTDTVDVVFGYLEKIGQISDKKCPCEGQEQPKDNSEPANGVNTVTKLSAEYLSKSLVGGTMRFNQALALSAIIGKGLRGVDDTKSSTDVMKELLIIVEQAFDEYNPDEDAKTKKEILEHLYKIQKKVQDAAE
jgi:hypothetical protein